MKKTLLLFVATIFSLLNLSTKAQDIPVRVDVDDPSRVAIAIDYKTNLLPDIHAGINEFNVEYGAYVLIMATPGNTLVQVQGDEDGYTWDENIYSEEGITMCDFQIYSDWGAIYHVTSKSESETNTASVTINIDDPSKAIVELVKSDKVLDLSQGENKIEFNPDFDTQIKISPTGKDLYRVVLNGEPQKTSWSYTLDIKDGDNVDIMANFPDKDCKVKFTLTGDDVEDFITRVEVDGSYASNYLDPNFTVKAGQELTIYGDTQDYEVQVFTLNGIQAHFTNPTTILVDQDLEVVIDVQKYASFKVTVNIDDPSHIVLYNGYHYDNNIVELKKGANAVDVIRNRSRLEIAPVEGFYVESITFDDDSWIDDSDLKAQYIILDKLFANDVINITTAELVRDSDAMLFVSNLEAGYLKVTRVDGTTPIETVAEGYNKFAFSDRDNTFTIDTRGTVPSHVYVNEKAVSETYPESMVYEIDLSHNHVVKVFFGEQAPESYQTSVEVDPELLGTMSLTRDHLTDVDGWHNNFNSLEGSHCTLDPKGKDVEVSYDNQELSPDESGLYHFTVNKNASLVVKAQGTTGLDSVINDIDGSSPVYDLRGVKVRDNSSRGTIETLTPGIYIVDGVKFIKR